jgi:Raf kinase inhibitor-like YbhB/YbcL family protein
MIIRSTYSNGQEIPKLNTCMGPNVNPPLFFDDIPEEAKSLVLIFEDIDAIPIWTHWMVFNIPPTTAEIKEGSIPEGAVEGLANNHSFGYEGPCPKYFEGIHHYWFRLYALDIVLDLPAATEREVVEEKMKDHVVAKSYLLGLCNSKSTMFENV